MGQVILSAGDPRWQSFVAADPNAIIFHHPAWLSAIASSYGYDPFVLAVLDDDDCVVAGLPLMYVRSVLTGRRIVGLPFTDFCPPLASDAQRMDELVTALQVLRRTRHVPRLEVRWPLPEQPGIFTGETTAWHVTHLDPDPERMLASFKRSAVSTIRQAEKSGLTTQISNEWEQMAEFYHLHLETRRRLGVPVQPQRYFRMLWEHVICAGLGFVMIARLDGKPVSGGIFMNWQKTVVYKYSASDSEYWRLRPNNLMVWHAMQWAIEHGYQDFDWGRSDLADEGLRSFKRHMAGVESLVTYAVLADGPVKAKTDGRSRQLLAHVIQKSPPWVCQALGESLYGHMG